MSTFTRVKDAKALEPYKILLTFTNGEKKVFDVAPYLDFGVFSALKDPDFFYRVRPCMGTISWPNEIDLCPDTLYSESTPVKN
jgi:hypothetical protein